jgi:hypothetical protein
MIHSEAEWIYYKANPWGGKSENYKKYTNLGDTLINNQIHHKIREAYFKEDTINGDDVIYDYIFLVRQEGETLYSNQIGGACISINNNSPFNNLEAQIGDTLGIVNFAFNPDSLTYILAKKDSVILDGKYLKRNIIDVLCNQDIINELHMLERVGTVSWGNDYFGNWKEYPFCVASDFCSPSLFIFHSYSDNEISIDNYYPFPPRIDLEWIGEFAGCQGDTLSTTISTIEKNNPILSYLWNFPNGIPTTSTDSIANVSFINNSNGFNEFYLETTNVYGSSLDTFYYYIQDQPQANFTYSSNGNTIQFENTTEYSLLLPKYIWDFGDNQTSEEINPIHNYEHGNYLVSLKSYDHNNLCDTSIFQLQIEVLTSNNYEINNNNKFEIFPNPNSGVFNIQTKGDVELEDIIIINHLGKRINYHVEQITDLVKVTVLDKGIFVIRFKIADK